MSTDEQAISLHSVKTLYKEAVSNNWVNCTKMTSLLCSTVTRSLACLSHGNSKHSAEGTLGDSVWSADNSLEALTVEMVKCYFCLPFLTPDMSCCLQFRKYGYGTVTSAHLYMHLVHQGVYEWRERLWSWYKVYRPVRSHSSYFTSSAVWRVWLWSWYFCAVSSCPMVSLWF